jgi:histidinol-phosphate aminotransferase
MSIHIPEFVQKLQAYKPGKPISELKREKNLSKIVKLASNENPLGPSPMAMAAATSMITELHRYPDFRAFDLIKALSKNTGKPPDTLISASGSDSLISSAINALTEEKDQVLTSEGTFIGLYVNVKKLNRKLKCIPLKNYTYDLDAILNNIDSQTKIIYLANPNNPTGTFFTSDVFKSWMSKVPDHILVILDEAYTVYAQSHEGYPNGLDLDYPNLLVLRTLAKSHGLAGLRIGFAWGPEQIIQAMYRVKLPFEPSVIAQYATIAALEDLTFLKRTVETNQRNLKKLQETASKIGIEFPPSATNFIMLILPNESAAEQFVEGCLNEGLIVRGLKPFGIPQGVRVNSGTDEETDWACTIIKKVHQNIQ